MEDLYERQAREFITLNLHQSENALPLERRKADLLMDLHDLVNKGEKQGNLWRLRNWRQLRAWKKQITRGEATAALQLQASHLEELRLANRLAFVSAREAHRYAAALNRATRLLAIVTAGMIFIGAVQLVTNVVL